MRKPIRMTLAAIAFGVSVSAVSLGSASAAPSASSTFNATFVESNQSFTDRMPDLGVVQLINSGSGTVERFGPATVVLAMSQDRSVAPCGPGSWTNAGTRRIVVAKGVLVLREVAEVCETEIGQVARGTWAVDGASSTGVFAGARGSGRVGGYVPARMSTLWGSVTLRGKGR